MLNLQEVFDEQLKSNVIAARVLEIELEKVGVILTDAQRSDFESQFKNYDGGSLTFDFDDEQLDQAGFASEDEFKPTLEATLENFTVSLQAVIDVPDEAMEDIVTGVTDSMAESVKETLDERIETMLEDQEAISCHFYEHVDELWGYPLDLLQGLIVISDEAGQGYLERTDKYSNDSIGQHVLLRIHAKANQIAKEILVLLRNGFADGAEARWRSLHELAVISNFIAEYGDESARKYILHDAIERYEVAKQHNQFHARNGEEKISSDEMRKLENEYNELLTEFGRSYRHEYGWAAKELGSKRPTFRDLEAVVELEHYRASYKLASANIHGNSTGVLSRLGVSPDKNILLSGPSNVGLEEPAISTVESLTQITAAVLTYNTNIDFIVVCKAMSLFGKDVYTAIQDVAKAVEKRKSN